VSQMLKLPHFPCISWHGQIRISNCMEIMGHAVVQLVETLLYKPEGRGFDSHWCYWNFSLTSSFWPPYGPWVDSASNRNEYQEDILGHKGDQCIGLTMLLPSCANCLEIWELQPRGTLSPVQACTWIALPFTCKL
jgi:hypothetical protein